MVEHRVNDDPRDRNIQPDGKGPAHHPEMGDGIAPERTVQRRRHQGRDHYRQDHMADQQGVIDRTHRTFAPKHEDRGGEVIEQIKPEKQTRRRHRRQHGRLVQVAPAQTDEHEPRQHEYQRARVQGGGDVGKAGRIDHRACAALTTPSTRQDAATPRQWPWWPASWGYRTGRNRQSPAGSQRRRHVRQR